MFYLNLHVRQLKESMKQQQEEYRQQKGQKVNQNTSYPIPFPFLSTPASTTNAKEKIIFFFLSRFSFMNIHDLKDNRGRGKVSI